MLPKMKATIIDANIAEINLNAPAELMYSLNSSTVSGGDVQILNNATNTAAPNSSKISDTVVDVGKPKVLNTSNIITSQIITARKIIITSWKVNIPGSKTPLRAISIKPFDVSVPAIMPREATIRTTHRAATLEPMLELRKLTASLATPTVRSTTANATNTITIIK